MPSTGADAFITFVAGVCDVVVRIWPSEGAAFDGVALLAVAVRSSRFTKLASGRCGAAAGAGAGAGASDCEKMSENGVAGAEAVDGAGANGSYGAAA